METVVKYVEIYTKYQWVYGCTDVPKNHPYVCQTRQNARQMHTPMTTPNASDLSYLKLTPT